MTTECAPLMRAITLTQPWCGLMAAGIKRVENRSRPLIRRDAIGTDIAFHASREIDEPVYARIAHLAPELVEHDRGFTYSWSANDWYRLSRITSAITHVATLVDILVVPDEDDADDEHRRREFDMALARGTVTEDQWRWYFGRHGYVFTDERALPAPVPCRGWQGCWTLTPQIDAAVRAALAEVRAA